MAALAAIACTPDKAQAACVAAADFDGVRLPTSCLSPTETRVVRLRMFRADLAVAALSCHQQTQYNNLVTRHQDELVRQGQALRALFQRIHHANAERELNRFITHLANRASLKRLEQPRYCQDMNRVFQEAQAQPRQGLMAYVQARTLQGEPVRHLAAMDTAAGDKPSKRPVLED